jgi:Ribbon-helix-helix domain
VPSDKRKFVNPLTQPSTSTSTYPVPTTNTPTETETLPDTYPSTYSPQSTRRKRGAQAFERTHERITLWLDKGLKERFEALAEEQGIAKSALLDEAISDLLKKYKA